MARIKAVSDNDADDYVDPWRAKQDASTLADAEMIRGDKKRHAAAQAHVKTLASAVGIGPAEQTGKGKPAKKTKPLTVVQKPTVRKPVTKKGRGK